MKISAVTGEGLDDMVEKLTELLHAGKREITFVFPQDRQGKISLLYSDASVKDVQYGESEVRVRAVVDRKVFGLLGSFVAPEDRTAFGVPADEDA